MEFLLSFPKKIMPQSTVSLPNTDLFRLSLAGAISVLVMGLFMANVHPLFFCAYVLIPVILTIRSGVDLDLTTLQYRKFSSVLGKKRGEWKSFSTANQLALLTKSGSKEVVNMRGMPAMDVPGEFYELYLMDPSHLKRLFLYSTKSRTKVKAIIDSITRQSAIQLVPFNPSRR